MQNPNIIKLQADTNVFILKLVMQALPLGAVLSIINIYVVNQYLKSVSIPILIIVLVSIAIAALIIYPFNDMIAWNNKLEFDITKRELLVIQATTNGIFSPTNWSPHSNTYSFDDIEYIKFKEHQNTLLPSYYSLLANINGKMVKLSLIKEANTYTSMLSSIKNDMKLTIK